MFRTKSGTPLSKQTTKLSAIRVTTSTYGLAVPILIGTQRLSAKILDYTDFDATSVKSTQSTGGKGGLFGGGSTSSTTYTYSAAVDLLLCQGPGVGLLSVWDTSGKSDALTVTETYTVPSSLSITVANADDFYFDVGVAYVSTQNAWVNDQWNNGMVVIGDPSTGHYETYENTVGLVRVFPFPGGAGQYTVTNGVYGFDAADIGKQIQITYVYTTAADGSLPGQTYNFTNFLGTQPQSPWSFMTGAHPERALSYVRLFHVASDPLDLGTGGSLPNLSFEIAGMAVATGYSLDANPADIAALILTDFFVGAGLNPSVLDTNADYRAYCQANSLFLSLLVDSQRQVSDIMTELLSASNAAAVWADGLLRIIPFGDQWAAGNGATFQPDTTPAYDLNVDDFIVGKAGAPPIRIRDKDFREAYNNVRIEFLNRALDYNPDIMPDFDQAHIDLYGLRTEDPQSWHVITTAAAAKVAASNHVKRNCYIDPRIYEFTLSPRYIRLLPMCLVTITEPNLGLNKVPVRIITITEDEKGNLAIEAEPFPFANASATLYPKQAASPVNVNPKADPGDANPPIVFEYPDSISPSPSEYVVGVGVSGSGEFWGGASVWASTDDVKYTLVERATSPSRMGVLTADFPPGSDPDTTNTLSVDLTESGGVLNSGTLADRDSFRNLCYVDIGSAPTTQGPDGVGAGADIAVSGAVAWANPGNITADDTNYATATLSLSSAVVSVTLLTGGSGYWNTPTVQFSGGGGTGAAAIATIDGAGKITSVAVANGGTGYFTTDDLGINGGNGDADVIVTRTSNHTEAGGPGSVQAIMINGAGTGYTVGIYTTSGGTGSGCTVNVRAVSGIGAILSITLTAGGSGYTSAPAVAFIPTAGGSGGTASASLGAAPQKTDILAATNPNPGLSLVVRIVGIKLEVKGHQSAATASGLQAQLTLDGMTGTGTLKSVTSLPTSDAYITFGGPTDTWGLALTGASVNPSSFGALLQGILNGGAYPITFSPTFARFTFYYTPPAAIGEFVSFETATLTAANKYNITSLRRGVFSSLIEDHPTGSNFIRVDDNVAQIVFEPKDVGINVFVKLTSFNVWGLNEQNIADVAAYSFQLHGFYNNVFQVVANNATSDWDPTSWTGSTWTGRVYGKSSGSPTPGQAITFQRADGTTFTTPAQTFPGIAGGTTFWALFNPYQQSVYLLTVYSQVLAAQGNGHILLGQPFTTPVSNVSGGGTSGGGGGFQGGSAPDKPGGYLL